MGIRRNTSREVALRWRDETSRRLPPGDDGRLVFSFGVNDTALEEGRRRVEEEDSLHNFRSILGEAASMFPVLMVGPPPVEDAGHNARIAYLSAEFQSTSRNLGIPYLDVFTPLSGSAVWVREVAQGDGAHPGARGYGELASLVEAWPAWRVWFEERN